MVRKTPSRSLNDFLDGKEPPAGWWRGHGAYHVGIDFGCYGPLQKTDRNNNAVVMLHLQKNPFDPFERSFFDDHALPYLQERPGPCRRTRFDNPLYGADLAFGYRRRRLRYADHTQNARSG